MISLGLLTLRQRRFAVAAITAIAALASVVIVVLNHMVAATPPDLVGARPWLAYGDLTWEVLYFPTGFGALVAVFVGAPLVSREYENRTHVLAWSQDVRPRRWLAGHVLFLAGLAVLLSVLLSLLTIDLLGTLEHVLGARYPIDPFDAESFDASVPVMLGHTVFGFALGLAFSVLTRNTLLAMGLTLVGFVGTRMFAAVVLREHYLPPIRTWRADSPEPYIPQVPADGRRVDSGVEFVNGVRGHFAEFQTADRLGTFQLIETGLFLLVAAGLLGFAFWWVGRLRRI
ncbi:hypothetical protein KIPE111705_43515 [Kibdelosporangium persicum]|uniref:Transmembrane transport protein n=1 Tax=Kibdelosporangium persicum TaxID=2698649 RepID=A0ABX2F440_9PSEU|nr:hypothetical protein [Kibdelosporangium persicum]NRN65924.1 putative transmembrane transport protein [Kibdelosporangium persicum]